MLKFLSCCLLIANALTLNAQSFDINDWFVTSSSEPLSLSPSGNSIVWFEQTGAGQSIIVQTLGESASKSFSLPSSHTLRFARLIDEHFLVVHTSDDVFHRVYGVDLKANKNRLLIEQKSPLRMISQEHDQHGFYFLENNQLLRFDFRAWQKSSQLPVPEDTESISFDNQNSPCLAIDNRGQVFHYQNKVWQTLEISDQTTQIEHNGSCDAVWNLTFNGSNTRSIFKKLLTHSTAPIETLAQEKVDIGEFWVDSDKQKVIGYAYHDVYPEIKPMDDRLNRLNSIMQQFKARSYWTVIASNPSHTHWLVSAQNPSSPEVVYHIELGSRKVTELKHLLPQYPEYPWANTDAMVVNPNSKHPIVAYLTKPNKMKKDWPVIIKIHGGPFKIRDYWKFDPEAQWLAGQGIATLVLNYRGSSGFGKEFQSVSFGQLRQIIEDDIDDVLDYVEDHYSIDEKKIGLMGSSFGGFAVLSELVENPSRYRFGVLISPVVNLTWIGEALTNDAQKKEFKSQFGDPTNQQWRDDNNLLNKISDIKAPIQIFYGAKDTIVSSQHSLALIEKIKKQELQFEQHGFEDAGHRIDDNHDRDVLYSKLQRFLIDQKMIINPD